MGEGKKAFTFSDCIKAAAGKGVSLDMLIRRQDDFERMVNSGIPTFHYELFDGDIEKLRSFKEKYPLICHPQKKCPMMISKVLHFPTCQILCLFVANSKKAAISKCFRFLDLAITSVINLGVNLTKVYKYFTTSR